MNRHCTTGYLVKSGLQMISLNIFILTIIHIYQLCCHVVFNCLDLLM